LWLGLLASLVLGILLAAALFACIRYNIYQAHVIMEEAHKLRIGQPVPRGFVTLAERYASRQPDSQEACTPESCTYVVIIDTIDSSRFRALGLEEASWGPLWKLRQNHVLNQFGIRFWLIQVTVKTVANRVDSLHSHVHVRPYGPSAHSSAHRLMPEDILDAYYIRDYYMPASKNLFVSVDNHRTAVTAYFTAAATDQELRTALDVNLDCLTRACDTLCELMPSAAHYYDRERQWLDRQHRAKFGPPPIEYKYMPLCYGR
jgi:hypothetical protein